MSAVLASPPPGVTMRPFRVVDPIVMLDDFGLFASGDISKVICVGPFSHEADVEMGECWSRTHLEREARRSIKPRYLADTGLYFCSADQGRYVMLWRVAKGRPRKRGPGARVQWDYPPRKLAHWEALEADVAMILCPEPDDDAIDAAISRTARMRAQSRGRFQPFFDDAGALWVTRLPDAP